MDANVSNMMYFYEIRKRRWDYWWG